MPKIKIYFSTLILIMIVFVGGGSFVFKDIFNKKNTSKFYNYLKYKRQFSALSNENVRININNTKSESIPVLLYHGIVNKSDDSNMLVEDFKEQMFALKKAGYQTISIKDFYQFTKEEKELPNKSFLLTFDDGRSDSYYPVDPILKALDYRATMFVMTYTLFDKKAINSQFYLSEKELKRMQKSGRWDLQSHGEYAQSFQKIDDTGNNGHFLSNKLWIEKEKRLETNEEFKDRIYNDLFNAKKYLNEKFGMKVISFAYPYGDYGQESINYPEMGNVLQDAVKSIYPASFYQANIDRNFIGNHVEENNHFFKRISVKPNWSSDELLKILEVGETKEVPFVDNFENYAGWKKTYGSIEYGGKAMVLNASGDSTGNSVFLDGTRLWQNYAFESIMEWKKGSNIFLLAQYADEKNYTACNFSDDSVRIEERINGEKRILKEVKRKLEVNKNNFKTGVRVNNNSVECLLSDKIVVYSNELVNISSGGIGFKTWDKEKGNSEIIVHNVSVADEWNNKEQIIMADPSSEKIMPFVIEQFNQDQGWIRTWGEKNFENGYLAIKSTEDTTGSMVFLDGAKKWQNYTFMATADWEKGNNILLIARYTDEKNYITFNISDDYFRIEEFIDGEKKILEEIKKQKPFSKQNIKLAFNVDGDKLSGYINEKLVINVVASNQADSCGGIGFKTWDKEKGNSKLVIKDISVE